MSNIGAEGYRFWYLSIYEFIHFICFLSVAEISFCTPLTIHCPLSLKLNILFAPNGTYICASGAFLLLHQQGDACFFLDRFDSVTEVVVVIVLLCVCLLCQSFNKGIIH